MDKPNRQAGKEIERLQGSEEFYRLLVETMSDGLGVQDARGSLTYVNDRLCEIWGYTREEILGRSAIDFVDEPNRETFVEHMDKRHRGEEGDYEIEFLRKDGNRVATIISPRIIRDEAGCYAGSFAVVTDITERKKMEKGLHKREEILGAVAYATDRFLRSYQWRRDIQDILGRLGTATDVSRVRIFQRWGGESGDSKAALLFEWAAPGISVATGDRALQEFFMREAGLGRWAEAFEGGGIISGDVDGFPPEEQPFLSRHGIISIIVAPIFVSSQWWGMLGFNDCKNKRKWSSLELDSLGAVAETLGAAIERGHAEEEITFQAGLLNMVEQAVIATDLEGRITYWNKFAEKLYGWKSEDVLGRDVVEVTPSDATREQAEEIMRHLAGGESWSGEFMVKRRDGTTFPALVHDSPILDHGRHLVGIVGISSDISERKLAEEALHLERNKLRGIMDAIPDGVYVVDQAYEIQYVNPALENAFGPVKGRRCHKYFHERSEPCPWCVNEEVFAGNTVHWEFTTEKDGKTYDLFDTPLTNQDGSVFKLEILKDITASKRSEQELRASEEKYRELVENANSIILKMDAEGRITFFNEFAQRFFGYREDEVLGRNVIGTIVPVTDTAGRDMAGMVEELLADPDLYMTNENENIKHDGERIWVAWTNKAILDNEGEFIGILAIGNDISRRKLVEDELKENQIQLRDFLTIAAHELRHPITVINGYVKTFMEHLGSLSPGTLEHILKALDVSSNRLIQIADSLLDVARIEQEHLCLEMTEISLTPLLERTLEEMRVKGIENVVGVTAPPGEVRLVGDPEKLVRVLVVLLDNAAKFAPPRSAVEIHVTRGDARLLISVLDRGIGIPEEARDKIFDRFYQVEEVMHHSAPGLGFGLYVAQVMVEAHGGRIWCEPREGGGSIFRVALPLA